MKVVKGDTVEKQIKNIDVVLKRLLRRSRKVAVGIVPPAILPFYSENVESGDVVLSFLAPVPGVIRAGGIFLEGLADKRVDISLTMSSGVDVLDYGVNVKEGFTRFDREIGLKAGDRVSVSILGTADKVWISLAFEPVVPQGHMHKVMLDELDKLEEYELGDLT